MTQLTKIPADSLKIRLKCDPEPFQAAWQNLKRAELRVNDRDFQVGQTVMLEEYDRATGYYTERRIRVRITHIQPVGPYGAPNDMVMFSFSVRQRMVGDKLYNVRQVRKS